MQISSDDLERRPVDSSTRLGPFSAARLCFLLSTLKRLNMKKTNFSLEYQRAAYNSVFLISDLVITPISDNELHRLPKCL